MPTALITTADGWSLCHEAQARFGDGGTVSTGGWTVHVEVVAPLVGRILSYDGDVAPAMPRAEEAVQQC